MSKYNLYMPVNKEQLEKRLISERITLLMDYQTTLTGDDFRRCKKTIDYNRKLLNDPKATFNARR